MANYGNLANVTDKGVLARVTYLGALVYVANLELWHV